MYNLKLTAKLRRDVASTLIYHRIHLGCLLQVDALEEYPQSLGRANTIIYRYMYLHLNKTCCPKIPAFNVETLARETTVNCIKVFNGNSLRLIAVPFPKGFCVNNSKQSLPPPPPLPFSDCRLFYIYSWTFIRSHGCSYFDIIQISNLDSFGTTEKA